MAQAVSLSASAVVKPAGGLLWGFEIGTANAGTIKIWDSTTGTAGDRVILDTTTAISAPFNGRFPAPVECVKGIYLTIAGTSATVTVFYE